MLYKCTIDVSVEPVVGYASVSYGIIERKQLMITEPVVLTNTYNLQRDNYVYELELHNDAQFKIVDVAVMGISDYKFLYKSNYTPVYPEPWRSTEGADWPDVLPHHQNISWPGVWSLNLESPVFPWIHHVLDLGEIH